MSERQGVGADYQLQPAGSCRLRLDPRCLAGRVASGPIGGGRRDRPVSDGSVRTEGPARSQRSVEYRPLHGREGYGRRTTARQTDSTVQRPRSPRIRNRSSYEGPGCGHLATTRTRNRRRLHGSGCRTRDRGSLSRHRSASSQELLPAGDAAGNDGGFREPVHRGLGGRGEQRDHLFAHAGILRAGPGCSGGTARLGEFTLSRFRAPTTPCAMPCSVSWRRAAATAGRAGSGGTGPRAGRMWRP